LACYQEMSRISDDAGVSQRACNRLGPTTRNDQSLFSSKRPWGFVGMTRRLHREAERKHECHT